MAKRMCLRLAQDGMSVPRPNKRFRFSGDMLECPSFTAAASHITVTFASWLTPEQMACHGRFTGQKFFGRT